MKLSCATHAGSDTRPAKSKRLRDYDEAYLGKGGVASRKASDRHGTLSRVKAGASHEFVCVECELYGMTLEELRGHYKQFHGDR